MAGREGRVRAPCARGSDTQLTCMPRAGGSRRHGRHAAYKGKGLATTPRAETRLSARGRSSLAPSELAARGRGRG